MKRIEARVAVVTGAASGIGLALVERFRREGMRVVAADIDVERLEEATAGLDVVAVETDVSDPKAVERLADAAFTHFGGVHVLCNNAGVAARPALTWEHPLDDWRWVIGVNLWGVIHGVRTFLPRMLEQNAEGWIVNTASVAGLMTAPSRTTAGGNAIYGATKHAVVSISERLYHHLRSVDAPIGVTVLCPGPTDTRIFLEPPPRPEGMAVADERGVITTQLSGTRDPAEVASLVLEAIADGRFYLITDDGFDDEIRCRVENILSRQNP